MPLVLKPGAAEPWTPSLIQALLQTGVPADALTISQ
jgi:hypothetical protein